MTDERAAIAARHRPYLDPVGVPVMRCENECGDWPCDTIRALALPPDPDRLARALHDAYYQQNLIDAPADDAHRWCDEDSGGNHRLDGELWLRDLAAAIIAAWEVTLMSKPTIDEQTIDEQIEELERIFHPEGRCEVCGGGKPYWKHLDPNADGYHAFIGPRGYEPVRRIHEGDTDE